jgi:hypothetical protein
MSNSSNRHLRVRLNLHQSRNVNISLDTDPEVEDLADGAALLRRLVGRGRDDLGVDLGGDEGLVGV